LQSLYYLGHPYSELPISIHVQRPIPSIFRSLPRVLSSILGFWTKRDRKRWSKPPYDKDRHHQANQRPTLRTRHKQTQIPPYLTTRNSSKLLPTLTINPLNSHPKLNNQVEKINLASV
jgi:hypothetical protein